MIYWLKSSCTVMVHTYLVHILSPFIKKTNALLAASNAEKIEALCAWIAENYDSTISWEDLTKNSGFSHNELISLFQVYKQQTPMAYIRGVRQQKNASRSSFPQHSLFIDIDKQSSDWLFPAFLSAFFTAVGFTFLSNYTSDKKHCVHTFVWPHSCSLSQLEQITREGVLNFV